MNISKRTLVIGLATGALACLGTGYAIRAARADGVPPGNPLTYGGTLRDAAGNPLTGTKHIEIKLWATNPATGQPLCDTPPAAGAGTTLGKDGYFEVTLDPTCTGVVHVNATTFVEVSVDGTSLGLTQLGAVPYALEAGRASDFAPTGPLATALAATISRPTFPNANMIGIASTPVNGTTTQILMQAGSVTPTLINGRVTIVLPASFPHQALSVVASYGDTIDVTQATLAVVNATPSSFDVVVEGSAANNVIRVNYIALGW